jgi:DNA helicase-2/ATP-dependent DNA helicase PcrA
VLAVPQDDLALERIINLPKRGIGQATMQHLHTTARNLNTSLYNAVDHLLKVGELKGKLGASLDKFMRDCERWRVQLESLPLAEVVELVLEESGYRQMWATEKSPEAAGRLENLKELVRAMGEFESLGAFLEHVSLVTEATNQNNGNDMISLMTLHAAKGLEFDVVFLPGWEEGVFPHQRSLDETGNKGLEEERRLAYVGITRARKKLFISHAANRRIYNQWQSSIPSRFIGEIPPEHVDKLGGGMYSAPKPSQNDWMGEVASILGTSSAKAEEAKFAKGTRVFHQKFGYGRIQSVNGKHLEIEFEKAGHKKVMSDYVEKAP